MVATVRLYKNTGLGVGNCLDSSLLLDSFEYVDVPDIAIKQPRYINIIRIGAEWDTIRDVDYCKINDDCYWVTSIMMLNDNVAEISMSYDAITSVGINNFKIISGWCSRRTLSSSEDALFENVSDEPFSPTDILTLYRSQSLPNNPSSDKTNVILSTVDLSKGLTDWQTAKFYAAQWEGEGIVGCAVPNLPQLTVYTTYILNDAGNVGLAPIANYTYTPGTALFDSESLNVQESLNYVYAISASNTILDSYELPSDYFTVNKDENGKILSVQQNVNIYTSLAAGFIDVGSYANKKVFSGQFLKIMLVSPSSGNSQIFSIEEILPGNKLPSDIKYYTLADGRYNGSPVIVPLTYKNNVNMSGLMLGSVTGSEWQRAPFVTEKTGVGAQMIQFNTGRYLKDMQMGLNLGGGLVSSGIGIGRAYSGLESGMDVTNNIQSKSAYNIASTTLNAGTSILGNLTNMGIYQQQANAQRNYLSAQQSASEIHFMNVPTNVSYFGNIFFELVYTLSAADMKRFDTFLTAFGYSVSEELKDEHLKNNPSFDYIKADSISIELPYTLDVRNSIIKELTNGVRIWHKKPVPIQQFTNRG